MALVRFLIAFIGLSSAVAEPIVLTGATGHTGSQVYKLLKARGVAVRALVRNATKAKTVLGCTKCDKSEGIFVGDILKPDSLVDVMQGAGGLIILTSARAICNPFPKCNFTKGAYPVDVDFHGGKNQIEAFVKGAGGFKPAVLVSSMLTTVPDNLIDQEGNGYLDFYKLNLEAFLMSSGLPYTIIKPCGLADNQGLKDKLGVAHDDQGKFPSRGHGPQMQRADVARVVAMAAQKPELAANLRFDICGLDGSPTQDTDIPALFEAAAYPWNHKAALVV